MFEGWQVVESEGTPFPCGLGDDPPTQSGSGLALYGSVSPPSPESALPSSSIPPLVSSVPTPSAPSCAHSLH